jgi:hypothetical protein
MSDYEREINIPGISDASDSDRDQILRAREGRTDPSPNDDERRAAAADSRNDGPRISIDDLDASANAWGGQEYGEVM